MSVSSHALFHFTSPAQLEAVKRFKYKLQGRHQEKLCFTNIAEFNDKDLTCEFRNCFCQLDFEECIPALSRYVAQEVPDCSFSCSDAVFTNEVDGSELVHDISFDGAGNLEIETEWLDGDEFDEFDEEDFFEEDD